MSEQGIRIDFLPELNRPVLIAGFDGWGNALDISSGMILYLIQKLDAKAFASIIPDVFYRYDEARPRVEVEGGVLKNLSPPGGSLYAVKTTPQEQDLVLFKANEPNLRWFQFVEELFSVCDKLDIQIVITIGSMFDNVLHSDRIISGISTSQELFAKLKSRHIHPVFYRGPSAIHSVVHSEAEKKGIQSVSLWCHCPYYLQGTTHFGMMSSLGALLSFLGGFELDIEDLETSWSAIKDKIQELVDKSPELQEIIKELRKAKVRGSWATMKESVRKDEKIINLKDFLDPR